MSLETKQTKGESCQTSFHMPGNHPSSCWGRLRGESFDGLRKPRDISWGKGRENSYPWILQKTWSLGKLVWCLKKILHKAGIMSGRSGTQRSRGKPSGTMCAGRLACGETGRPVTHNIRSMTAQSWCPVSALHKLRHAGGWTFPTSARVTTACASYEAPTLQLIEDRPVCNRAFHWLPASVGPLPESLCVVRMEVHPKNGTDFFLNLA